MLVNSSQLNNPAAPGSLLVFLRQGVLQRVCRSANKSVVRAAAALGCQLRLLRFEEEYECGNRRAGCWVTCLNLGPGSLVKRHSQVNVTVFDAGL